MGTEILYPQDILIERLRFNPSSFSPHKNSNPNPKSSYRKEYRKRSPPPPPPQVKSEPLVSKKSTVPVLGQVTILKRGENLDQKSKNQQQENVKKIFSSDEKRKDNLRKSFSGDLQSFSSKKNFENLKKTFSGDLLLGGTQRLGPDPALVSVRLNDLKLGSDHVYAGSAFASSPSPRKLPLPRFSMKKEEFTVTAAVEESATKDLRRLLRLE